MVRCTNCNAELGNDGSAVFCPNCRKPLRTAIDVLDGTGTIIAPDVPDPTSSLLEQGKEFHGRFTIERMLGAGGMGVVYLADDKLTGRKVALKLINASLVNSDTARQRFIREGLIARDIRHKNVIAMYDVSEVDGQVYLVMEHLSGETLRKWLHRKMQAGLEIPFNTAIQIVRYILDGLGAAHATNVVHRDLKPDNIMFMGNPDQGDCSLKILDFGIARATGDNAARQSTTTSSSTGTPFYMAPEQKTAADTVGPPADFYAVSALFYELLIGVPPGGRWVPPSRERPDVPAGIDGVIEKGLSNRPRSRYATAAEYLAAIDTVTREVRPTPPPPQPLAPPPQPLPPTPPTPDPPKESWIYWNRLSKKQRHVFWIVVVGLLVVFGIIGYFEDAGSVENTNIAGRWFDELRGTNVPAVVVDIQQNGSSVSGSYYDYATGRPIGTLTGQMNGRSLSYSWFAGGQSGPGDGELDAQGTHLEVQVQGEQHLLHRDHLPGQ